MSALPGFLFTLRGEEDDAILCGGPGAGTPLFRPRAPRSLRCTENRCLHYGYKGWMEDIGQNMMKGFGCIVAAIVGTLLLLGGCSPTLSPLYRDYVAPTEAAIDSASVESRIVAALEDAGWDTVATDLPNAIATEEKVLSNWGLYRVGASLEVAPLGDDYVRLFVHPYRQYFIGNKGKIVYLTARVESRFIPELNTAFENQGLKLAGTPFERDNTVLR